MAPGNYGSFHHLQADDVRADNCSDFHCLFHCGFHRWPRHHRGMFHRNLLDGKDPNVQSPPGVCWETTNPGGLIGSVDSEVWKFVPQKSNDLSNRTFTFRGHEKKTNPNHALFSKEVSKIFHIMFASSFESPRSHGSHWSNDPCRYKCRDCSREMLRESSLVLRVWTERIQAKLGIQDSASPTLPKSYQLLSYVNYTDSWTSNRVYLICIRIRIMFRRTIWNSLTYGFFTWILFPSPLWVSRLVFSRFRFLLKHALTGRR